MNTALIIQGIKKPKKAIKYLLFFVKNKFLWEYYFSKLRAPKKKIDSFPLEISTLDLIQALKQEKIPYELFKIDKKDYQKYLKKARYHKFPNFYSGGKIKGAFVEKTLEHYIAAKLINFSENDIYVDIASASSPTPEIYSKIWKIKSFRQDLVYSPGIQGNRIGGDACNMPIKNESINSMALHCSYEHFQKDADSKFIKEASRVLKKNGKLCILPLYTSYKYGILTNPVVSKNSDFEKNTIIMCTDKYKQIHSRFYDIKSLIKRVINQSKNIKTKIYIIPNAKEIDKSCYLKYALVLEKK